jgi:hypothetical protein
MKDVRTQDHTLAATVGSVIDRAVLVGRKIANLGDPKLDQISLNGFAHEACLETGRNELRKQSEKLDGAQSGLALTQ